MNNIISLTDAAELLGISRVALFNQIKAGKVKAKKIGNMYVINKDDLPIFDSREVSTKQKNRINKAIDKTIADYSETLKLLKET